MLDPIFGSVQRVVDEHGSLYPDATGAKTVLVSVRIVLGCLGTAVADRSTCFTDLRPRGPRWRPVRRWHATGLQELDAGTQDLPATSPGEILNHRIVNFLRFSAA